MGYWSQDRDGNSFAGDDTLFWGDEPADLLGDCLDAIEDAFQASFGRSVTLGELRAGLEFVLGKRPDEDTYADAMRVLGEGP